MSEGNALEGSVLWFNEKRGYGFLRREDGNEDDDVYFHSTGLMTKGASVHSGDRVRFVISKDEESEKTAAECIEIIEAAPTSSAPPLDADTQERRQTTAPRSSSRKTDKSKKRRVLHIRSAQLLQMATFTVTPFSGDKATAVIVPETMDIEGEWIASFANDMQGVVAFVKRKEQPSGEGDIGHEEDQDEDETETEVPGQKQSRQSEFLIRFFSNGIEIDQNLPALIACSRALWDRRMSGIQQSAKQIAFFSRAGFIVTERCANNITSGKPREERGNKASSRHWIRVSVGSSPQGQVMNGEQSPNLTLFGAKAINSAVLIGDTLVVEVDSEELANLDVDMKHISGGMSALGAQSLALTAMNADNDMVDNRIFERAQENGQMQEGTVHGYSRRDVGAYWMRKLDTPSLSAHDLLGKANWRAEFTDDTQSEVSILAQSVIVFRGTLTPPATGAKLIKAWM